MSLTKVSYSMINGAQVNVLDFGAATSASASENTTAFQAAIDSVKTVGGIVYVPAGTFLLNAQLLCNMTAVNTGVAIVGAGKTVSKLVWSVQPVDGALKVTQNADSQFVKISDLSVLTSIAGVGTGISVQNTLTIAGTSSVQPHCDIVDVYFAANTEANLGVHYWLDGIRLTDVWNSNLININSIGDPCTSSGVSLSNSTIEILGESNTCTIINPILYHGSYGIIVGGTAEGTSIISPNIVGANIGINSTPAAPQPLLTIIGGHIEAFTTGIYLGNRTDSCVTGMLIYKQSGSIANFIGLYEITGTQWNRIVGNKIAGAGAGGTSTGIQSAGTHSNITANRLTGMTTGIYLVSPGALSNAYSNGIDSCTNKIVDTGLNNIVNSNTTPPASVSIGDYLMPFNSALSSVDSAGTGVNKLVSAATDSGSNRQVLLGGGYSGGSFTNIVGTGATSLPGASATANGTLAIDTTNNRLCFYANGNRYYLTATGTF